MLCLAPLNQKLLPPPASMHSSYEHVSKLHSSRFGRHTQVQQKRQKELYDQRASGPPYSSDDLVCLHCPPVPWGWSRKLHRPFRIVKILSEVHYRIPKVGSPRKCLVVQFDRLKLYLGNPHPESIHPQLTSPSTGPSTLPSTLPKPTDQPREGQCEHNTATGPA